MNFGDVASFFNGGGFPPLNQTGGGNTTNQGGSVGVNNNGFQLPHLPFPFPTFGNLTGGNLTGGFPSFGDFANMFNTQSHTPGATGFPNWTPPAKGPFGQGTPPATGFAQPHPIKSPTGGF